MCSAESMSLSVKIGNVFFPESVLEHLDYTGFFIKKAFNKLASKITKSKENVKKISSLKCANAAIFKTADFSKSSLKVIKLNKIKHFFLFKFLFRLLLLMVVRLSSVN